MQLSDSDTRPWRRTRPPAERLDSAVRSILRFSSLVLALQLSTASTVLAAEMDSRRFLEQLRRLAVEQSLAMENVESFTGWALKSMQSYPDHGKLEYVWTGEVDGRTFEISGSGSTKSKEIRFRAVLPGPPFCIDRNTMISIYGTNFRKERAINFEDYPDERSLSGAVQSNLAIIGWAPYYEYFGTTFQSVVSFHFFFSECASAILIRLTPKT